VDARLPGLTPFAADAGTFDLILLVGVWQHLPPEQHAEGIHSLARLLAPGGGLILSLRHGPGSPKRPCFPAEPDDIIRHAEAAALTLERRRPAPSIQQENRDAGVTWTWLSFRRATGG
jgi:SAM-dependent methyltransferase